MNAGKFLLAGVALLALFVVSISGCESSPQSALQDEIQACRKIVEEQEAKIAGLESFRANAERVIEEVFDELAKRANEIKKLEEENTDLRKKLRLKRIGTEGLIKGVEELRALQKKAAQRHRAKKAADANKPSVAE